MYQICGISGLGEELCQKEPHKQEECEQVKGREVQGKK